MDDELIRVAGLAARVACQRMTPRYLKALSDSIEQVCCWPGTVAWDRKATAYAEIVNLLALPYRISAPYSPPTVRTRQQQRRGTRSRTNQNPVP